MLADVTPVLLTYNEAFNLPRTLAALGWAKAIVVVDSGSTDGTLALLQADPRVRVFHRAFDSHAAQWNYAIAETGIATPWILALDADYVLPDALVVELGVLRPPPEVNAFRARFEYCVRGRRLWGSLYPPVTVLFRAGQGHYVQDGHTQRLQVSGRVEELRAPIAHDDRKPFAHWRAAQRRYAALEAEKLGRAAWFTLSWPDRVRRMIVVAPPAVLLYCLLVRGGLFQGLPGWTYAFQRFWAEVALARALVSNRVRR